MEDECLTDSEDKIRRPRGRPRLIRPTTVDSNIKRAGKGRPKGEVSSKNEEEIKKYNKLYYEKNKNKGSYLRQKDDYCCEVCNLVVMYCNRSRHNKSQYHIKNEENKFHEHVEILNENLINKMSDEFCKLFYN